MPKQNSAGTLQPNFFIVGAPKCGTTAWVEYLKTHPDICFSPVKEPHYFCFDHNNWRFVENEEEYLQLFERCGESKAIGEASVRYLYSAVAANEIRKFNPKARIIIFVRDQEDFVPSWHNQMLYREQDRIEDFEEAWRLSGKRTKAQIGRAREPMFQDYKMMGKFSGPVERFFGVFPADQVRVFHFRDWTRDPRSTYLEIMRFLGIPDDGRTEFPRVNEAKHQKSRWLATLLINPPDFVRPVGRMLKRILGDRFDQLIGRLLQANRQAGYLSETSEELRREIREYYAADNARLEPRIWKLPRHTINVTSG